MTNKDVEFLESLLPPWVFDVPKGLCPTMYGTCSYEGDLKVKEKVEKILSKEKTNGR